MIQSDRDYNILLESEKGAWQLLKQQEIVNPQAPTIIRSLYSQYPSAVRHYLSLFPNNHLDAVDLRTNVLELETLLKQFAGLINVATVKEQDILGFIREKKAYFIIGSILKDAYRFGHHSLFIFPEFPLTVNFKVDYLLVGKNSDGYHFVFVELESPFGNITIQDGSHGSVLRKGINQIDQWEYWLEKNYHHLKTVFDKYVSPRQQLPREFTEYDKTRLHYVVVGGRRSNSNMHTYRLNRKLHEERKLQILHYDNIIELASRVIGSYTY